MGAHHQLNRLQQHIEIIADVFVDLFLGGNRRGDLGQVPGLGLVLAVLNDAADFFLGNESTLDAHRLVRAHRQEQPISLAHKFLRTGLVKDHA